MHFQSLIRISFPIQKSRAPKNTTYRIFHFQTLERNTKTPMHLLRNLNALVTSARRSRAAGGRHRRMVARDNPNRVSRLNKNPFVLGTSFDPSDVFAHPGRRADVGSWGRPAFYNCFLGRRLCTLPMVDP